MIRILKRKRCAISGNKIMMTGTNHEVLKLKGKQTKIIDAKGNQRDTRII